MSNLEEIQRINQTGTPGEGGAQILIQLFNSCGEMSNTGKLSLFYGTPSVSAYLFLASGNSVSKYLSIDLIKRVIICNFHIVHVFKCLWNC
jgi:hypothetical protein